MAFFCMIPAAGSGARLGGALPKQYQMLGGQPLIAYALQALCLVTRLERIDIVLAPHDEYFATLTWPTTIRERIRALYVGGSTRHASVLNGLETLADDVQADDWVLVHDAARPGITPSLVNTLIDELSADALGGLLALPVSDTLKRAPNQIVTTTVERRDLWQAQTPQMFRYGLLRQALQRAIENPQAITDEASAIESLGLSPRLVMGSALNFKVTYGEDLQLAQCLLRQPPLQ